MGATLPNIPQLPNDVPLAGPPPNPVNGPAIPQTGGNRFGGIPGTAAQAPTQDPAPKFLVEAGMNIDEQLRKMSQAFPKAGSKFAQAKQLIQSGIADALQSAGSGAVTSSPTATGPNFTGTGGM